MSKLYRVISNVGAEDYGVKVGDICSFNNHLDDICAWFYNSNWDDDVIWCLEWSGVEEITEEVQNEF